MLNAHMVIVVLHAGSPGLVERTETLVHIAEKNEATMGKNQDYRAGYSIGEYLASQGEDLDIKEIDATANELLGELGYSDLPVNDVESFKDGMLNGYVFTSEGSEE